MNFEELLSNVEWSTRPGSYQAQQNLVTQTVASHAEDDFDNITNDEDDSDLQPYDIKTEKCMKWYQDALLHSIILVFLLTRRNLKWLLTVVNVDRSVIN